MSNLSNTTSESGSHDFIELMKNESKMSIIMILKIYQSLNLRQISSVMGISEPSTHAHVTELLENKVIELDPSMADKRGKYYKLNSNVDDILEKGEQEFESMQQNPQNKSYYENMASGLRALAMMSQRFGSYVANYLDQNAEELITTYQQKKEQGEESAKIVSGSLSFINIRSEEDYKLITEAYRLFSSVVSQINKKNEPLQPDEIQDVILVSGLVIPLFKLDPREI